MKWSSGRTWKLTVHIFILLRYFTSSGISLTSPALSAVSEQPLTLSQCSWTGAAARQTTTAAFYKVMQFIQAPVGACCLTCSHPVGVAADHPDAHPHSRASLPTAHYVSGTLSRVVASLPRTGHAAPSQTECISLSVRRRPAAFCIITRWVNHREWC